MNVEYMTYLTTFLGESGRLVTDAYGKAAGLTGNDAAMLRLTVAAALGDHDRRRCVSPEFPSLLARRIDTTLEKS